MNKRRFDMKKDYKIILSLIVGFSIVVIFFVQESFLRIENEWQIKILSSWKNNNFLKLTNLTNKNYVKVCVLRPYESDIINNSNLNELNLMNNYLKKISYIGDEGHWALVTLIDDKVEMFKFKRNQVDISYLGLNVKINFPKNFDEKDCMEFKNGFLYQFENENRKFIIFGERK